MSVWRGVLAALGFGLSKRFKGVQVVDPSTGKLTNRTVNSDTALQLSVVFGCVRLLSETIAGLPLKFSEVGPGGFLKPVEHHPLHHLLTTKPNRYQTNIEFFETLVFQLALHGNAYHRIDRNSKKDIVSLMPHMTPQITTIIGNSGDILHQYRSGSDFKEFKQDEVWHNKLFGNGAIGMSPLACARNAIGVNISAEDRVNKMANSGFKQAGILSIDKILKKEQRKELRESYQEKYDVGDDGLRVLEAGMKYTPIVANPKDVQFLETRRFQIEDIARFFGVPSVLINDTSASTVWGSGIEQILKGFYTFGLRPYLERLEASLKVWLLPLDERRTIVPWFDFDKLLRGDEKSRFTTYTLAVKNRILTPNECRKREGLEPLEGGNDFPILQGQAPANNNGGT